MSRDVTNRPASRKPQGLVGSDFGAGAGAGAALGAGAGAGAGAAFGAGAVVPGAGLPGSGADFDFLAGLPISFATR